jgi:hypothetical protein
MEFANNGSNKNDLEQLIDYYYRVKAGIGVHKNPKNYGAFPTDPYSHTPSMMGAQQPGMTGQVKEDILSRFNELGLLVANGEILVSPILLYSEDFIDKQDLNFTYCSTPFTYRKGNSKSIEIIWNDDISKPTVINSYTIPENISMCIFKREAKIARVVVNI